jgi:ubiquinone/menaquinone biosynthesis C-methylase UbiE
MRLTHVKVQHKVDIRAGTATEIPVPDGVADAIIVAQAFHWFSTDEALTEFARVLKPGGSLGLIWNFYDRDHLPEWQLQGFVLPGGGHTDCSDIVGHTRIMRRSTAL